MEKNRYESEIARLGLLVRELRIKEEITQAQLSTLCNVDVRTIQRIEKGKQNITISLLFTIADALKINSSILIGKIFSENL
ncbi:helix-turn-helix domain-containing protein [Flavobacterium cupreum]|uniref:helix-turn-helix domain-containing protein n=1 Tax=Flavobacterium cupreum TaxID=2133766 RepID=UPI0013759AA7|nr:helix-turn-helix transcriptional regulator [Flavobacterium cupreum]